MPAFAIKADRDQLVIDRLTATFAADVLVQERLYDVMNFTVKKDRLHDVMAFLRNELDFNFLTSICGMHHPGEELELGMVYFLHSLRNGHRIRVKTYMALKDAQVPTMTDLWAAANWMEREAWDFYGIKAVGHPNLKRILNMEDFPAFPMRKDYPLEDPTRQDKNDSMFGR